MTEILEEKASAGQVNAEAARIYDSYFVPALFGQFAEPLARAAGISEGDRVLDVACGTGAATRAAAQLARDPARVTGLDRNPGMLAVAREAAQGIDWREGAAEDLPFEDDSFDAVLCQFGLMFFDDAPQALREMRRVLAPGGHAAIAVWTGAETSPGYEAVIALIDRLFGQAAADALRAPFVLGDEAALRALLDKGGWSTAELHRHEGTARYNSISEWMRLDVRGWTLADMIDDAQFANLTRAAETELARFADADGKVAFAAPAWFAVLRA